MPTMPIIFAPLNKSVDKPELAAYSQDQRDGYWQEYISPDGPRLMWCKRPGLTEFLSLGDTQRVDGLHYWVRQKQLIAVCNQKIYRINSTPSATNITGSAPMGLHVRPKFCDVIGTKLYAASGGRIAGIPASGNAAYIADSDAPTSVRFIAPINRKLVALEDGSERFWWSEPGAPEDWQGQVATIESAPDLGLSMYSASGYLWFHGQSSIEVWRDDGATFVREGLGAIQRGCIAPYSVCEIGGSAYWLDDTREVCRLRGFSVEVISAPQLSRYLNTFSEVTDAVGDYLPVEGKHFYVLSFPTEGKTLVYDIGLNTWYEWGHWNPVTASYTRWRGSCVTVANDWNKVLAGDITAPKIWHVSGPSDGGASIRSVVTTDAIDRGTDAWKICHELTLFFRRSNVSANPKKMIISWRDGGLPFGFETEVPVESVSKTELFARARRLGKYRARTWQFIISDPTQAALVMAIERFEYASR